MVLRDQGVPVRIVYLGHRDGSQIMVAKNGPVRAIRDLRGRKFAIPSRFSNQYLVLLKLLEDEGIGPGEIGFVELPPPDMPGALASGAIEAYFVGEPFAAKAELDGSGRVLAYAKDIWPGFISCVLVVHEDLIRTRPEVVRDLVRGIASSGEWAETHREEAAARAAPYFRQDEKLLRYVLTQPPDRVSYRGLVPTDAEMAVIMRFARKAGILKRDIDLGRLLDTSFLQPEPRGVVPRADLPDPREARIGKAGTADHEPHGRRNSSGSTFPSKRNSVYSSRISVESPGRPIVCARRIGTPSRRTSRNR